MQYEFKPTEGALRRINKQSAITMACQILGESMDTMPHIKDELAAVAVRLQEIGIDMLVGEQFRGEVSEMALEYEGG